MALQPFTNEQLNYFKFSYIVLDEFPKALRQTFVDMWDTNIGHLPAYKPWDDSIAVRNMLLVTEGGRTKIPTHLPFQDWDCTALFQATIFARTFALPDSKGCHRTLSDLYAKIRMLPHSAFHPSVLSPAGKIEETRALAIDQLRLLRNTLCHLTPPHIDKISFDWYVQLAKDSFTALGVNICSIDAIGSLTEADFPTARVHQLQKSINKEIQDFNKFLEQDVRDELCGLRADVTESSQDMRQLRDDIKKDKKELRDRLEANTDYLKDISEIKKKIEELTAEREIWNNLPKSCIPDIVPDFTGRQRECDELVCHLNSESTRLVSIWGSPGFGKTSVAIAVGHRLHSQGLPVYFLSLLSVKSKSELVSKLCSIFMPSASHSANLQASERISPADELCAFLGRITERFVVILDNADELFGVDESNAKDDVLGLIEDFLLRCQSVTFLCTTRESLEFMNIKFKIHQVVRIRPLDQHSSKRLVHTIIDRTSDNDCSRITRICGGVPLAIKVLCSSISEDAQPPSKSLDELLATNESIVQMLDNPNYPNNLRVNSLFQSSFRRLSEKEQEAIVSLAVFSDSFDVAAAAAIMEEPRIAFAKRRLRRLVRASLLESNPKADSFLMHPIVQSFAEEKGKHEMKHAAIQSKARFYDYYISLFEKQNQQFLTGNSLAAFKAFYEDEQNICRSLSKSWSDDKVPDRVFKVLAEADLFLDSLFWKDGTFVDRIYDSALKTARQRKNDVAYSELLVAKAFGEVTWGARGNSLQLLSEANEIQESCRLVSDEAQGKRLCYHGMYFLVTGKTKEGIELIESSRCLLNGSKGSTILLVLIFQVLAIYYRSTNDFFHSSQCYRDAHEKCKVAGDERLLIIPTMENLTEKYEGQKIRSEDSILANQPIILQIVLLISKSTKDFISEDEQDKLLNVVLKIQREIEVELLKGGRGLFTFHRIVVGMLSNLNLFEEAMQYCQAKINIHQEALKLSTDVNDCANMEHNRNENVTKTSNLHEDSLAKALVDLGRLQNDMKDYSSALQSHQRALEIRLNVLGEQHTDTADSYTSLGITQYELGDYTSALQSHQKALEIRLNMLGEQHRDTAKSYHSLGMTQHELEDYTSAIQSKQRALEISLNLLGEQHTHTANSYHTLGITQHELGDYTSALQSKQRAFEIRLNLLGEQDTDTADGYHTLGITQHELEDYTSALHSDQRALEIRLNLLGEQHLDTAKSYHSLGITQYELGDYTSALQSHQRALEIKLNLLGEQHTDTADCYHSLGITQYKLRDYTSALQSHQRALGIRQYLLGEQHADTANSYHSLRITQCKL